MHVVCSQPCSSTQAVLGDQVQPEAGCAEVASDARCPIHSTAPPTCCTCCMIDLQKMGICGNTQGCPMAACGMSAGFAGNKQVPRKVQAQDRVCPAGPSVIVDQAFDQHRGEAMPDTPVRSMLVYPENGMYCLFEGHLAHGVLESCSQQDRATLLVNWWTRQPQVALAALNLAP